MLFQHPALNLFTLMVGLLLIVDFEDGTQAREVDITLRPAAILKLRVLKPDGTPYTGGLSLSWKPTGGGERGFGSLEADALGVAVCRRIVPGDYELRVTRVTATGAATKPREDARQTVHIRPGENELELRLERK